MLIPISHDRLQARRWPWVTIAILVLNLLIFSFTYRATANQEDRLKSAARAAVEYYVTHPYLDATPPLDEIVPHLLRDPRIGPQIAKGRTARVDASVRAEEQRELDQLCAALSDARTPSYLRTFAYTPARNNWLGLITSQFLHGGILHIVFNLWFLWLVGVNMEDRWGRLVFPFFYLSAGALACLSHKLYAPASAVPLIGASGAVAGAMGAFLVGFATARIRFMWILWVRIFFFQARAYLMLPLWLAMQVLYAFLGRGRDDVGVAYAAHVGGFVYGVAFALVMRASTAEKRIDEAIENDGAVLQDARIVRAAELTGAGDPRRAMALLEEVARETPGSIDAQLEMLRAAKAAGDRGREIGAYGRLIGLYLHEDLGPTAVDLYREMEVAGLAGEISPGLRLRIARQLEQMGALQQAAAELARVHAPGARDMLSLQAVIGHAQVLVRLRRREEALALYAAARSFPDVPFALETQIARGIEAAQALPDTGVSFA